MRAKISLMLQAGVIVLAGGWVYWPAVHGGWIWDDTSEIIDNTMLRNPAGIGDIWLRPAGVDYLPLKTTMQWLEWHLWGDRVEGYHLANIGLHLLSAFLLWHLLRKLGVGKCAWLGGLLFAVHPLMVESVAWISEFKNTLSLPFLLLAMIAYVDWDRGKPVPSSYFVSLLCFLAAMLCKSSVVMFPVVILLYCWWRRGRIARSDVGASAPFFAVSLILGLVTVWFQQHRAIADADLALGGFLPRCAGAGLAVFFYLWKYAVPVHLMPNYPPGAFNPPALWQFWPWAVIIAGIVWLLRWSALTPTRWANLDVDQARWGQRAPPSIPRHILFGLGFFLITLVPVLGFVPMAYLQISWVADHFAYLPLIGLIGLTTAAISRFIYFSFFRFLLLPLFAFLIWQSHRYARIFLSTETLWNYTLAHNPESWTAHGNLGNMLGQNDRWPEAIGHFEAVLRLKPGHAAAHNDLANALAQSGRWPEAIGHYEVAVSLLPRSAKVQGDFGRALLKAGRRADAIEHLEIAVRLGSGNIADYYRLGDALAQSGRLPEAIERYEAALRLRPDFAPVHVTLGNALVNVGRSSDAIAHYEAALRLEPGDADTHFNLGYTLAQRGRLPEAIVQFEETLKINPNDARAENNLGITLAKTGRLPEAIAQFEAVLRTHPKDAEAHNNLGTALNSTGRRSEAKAEFEKARAEGAR